MSKYGRYLCLREADLGMHATNYDLDPVVGASITLRIVQPVYIVIAI